MTQKKPEYKEGLELSENLNIIDYKKKYIWPEIDENYIKEEDFLIIIQVNGKVRKKIKFSYGSSQEYIQEYILNLNDIKKYIDNKEVKKIIYIKEKLVNIVTS